MEKPMRNSMRSDRIRPGPASGGFTLLELLVVLVIIGLLVGYVAPRYFSQVGKSEVKAARAQVKALEDATTSPNPDSVLRAPPPDRIGTPLSS